ncbi:unnamed protein product, partial [Meganyctiphanes norvegica]
KYFSGYNKVIAGFNKQMRNTHEHKRERLEIFCYDGEPKTFSTLFKTVELKLEIGGDNYQHFEANNASMVRAQYKDVSWFTFYPWKSRTFKLDLYNQSCVGVATADSFRIFMGIRWIDFWRVACLGLALLLFFTAPHLAKNAFFHYTTGVTVGICGSLLIIVYIISRYIPKKTGAATVLVGGWGLVVYAFQYFWANFINLIKEHQTVVVGYVLVAGLLSFALVYRYGPLTDKRSINLVQWAMQLVAVLAIFLSSQYREATLGIVLVIVTYHNVPSKLKSWLRTRWRRYFPPKTRLLTEEEYIQQANIETRKALEELRVYCQSPKCNSWKTVSRLNTPQRYAELVGKQVQRERPQAEPIGRRERFAEFVEGGSHLDDSEILSYEANNFTPPRGNNDIRERQNLEQMYLTTDDEEDDET